MTDDEPPVESQDTERQRVYEYLHEMLTELGMLACKNGEQFLGDALFLLAEEAKRREILQGRTQPGST